jgi:hypothetical protein
MVIPRLRGRLRPAKAHLLQQIDLGWCDQNSLMHQPELLRTNSVLRRHSRNPAFKWIEAEGQPKAWQNCCMAGLKGADGRVKGIPLRICEHDRLKGWRGDESARQASSPLE